MRDAEVRAGKADDEPVRQHSRGGDAFAVDGKSSGSAPAAGGKSTAPRGPDAASSVPSGADHQDRTFQSLIEDFSRADRMVVSGAMHYFRTFPRQWPHRLRTLRAMGANCVETYVPWNLHERQEGEFDFTGIADIEEFIRQAAVAGLGVIVRPGPYICAEWENGGLPIWLRRTNRAAPLRCADENFLRAVDAWFEVLIKKIVPHQADRGGPVIAVQVENEYGSYGSDKTYMEELAASLRTNGITVPLFTSDGPSDAMLTTGTLDDVLATVNFGSRPREAFGLLDTRRPGEAKWCMEFWNGWFDHWGEKHHVREVADAANDLDSMLAQGASVNIYMAHGGTNFATWAGANHEDGYQPTITSYDYDAPISEAGDTTEKYHAFREVIGNYLPIDTVIPEPEAVLPISTVDLVESVPLRVALPTAGVAAAHPPTFEELGLDHGIVLYRHWLRGPREAQALTLDGLADRAQVFVDGEEIATVVRGDEQNLEIACGEATAKLEILVESHGRVNFGRYLGEPKGLTDGVRLGRQALHGWTVHPLAIDDIETLPRDTGDIEVSGPRLLRGWLLVDEPGNAFLELPGGIKGYVWVNGVCLGRYWDRGPQRRLYLPWPLLESGDNEILVLELHPGRLSTVAVHDTPDLGARDEFTQSRG